MNAVWYPLISGMLVLGYAACALFFLRYWTTTRERLFLWFALAFFILASQRLALVVAQHWTEQATWPYVLRVAAYLLILAAIIDKNRPARQA
jgi:uncharacterized membrane protein HdeD (DUF308 family)